MSSKNGIDGNIIEIVETECFYAKKKDITDSG
jgi:hypothetical protein